MKALRGMQNLLTLLADCLYTGLEQLPRIFTQPMSQSGRLYLPTTQVLYLKAFHTTFAKHPKALLFEYISATDMT
jgi:hypothetical protein